MSLVRAMCLRSDYRKSAGAFLFPFPSCMARRVGYPSFWNSRCLAAIYSRFVADSPFAVIATTSWARARNSWPESLTPVAPYLSARAPSYRDARCDTKPSSARRRNSSGSYGDASAGITFLDVRPRGAISERSRSIWGVFNAIGSQFPCINSSRRARRYSIYIPTHLVSGQSVCRF